MSRAESIASFLDEKHNAVVAGIRRDGRPSMTPNWFFYDGSSFYISTMMTRAKFTMFSRDPRVELLIDDPVGNRYVRVSGTVEIWEDLDRMAPLVRQVRVKYGREVGDDAALRENLIAEKRVLLVIHPEGSPADWTANGF